MRFNKYNIKFYKAARKVRSKITPIEREDLKYLTNRIDTALEESRLGDIEPFLQHRGTSRLTHCVAVTYYSYFLCKTLRLKCDIDELVTGALLHDYYFYDWRDIENHRKCHAQVHPQAACHNASMDFELTDKEKDIIAKHMFPLTKTPPAYRESAIVCLVDKFCAAYEFFSRKTYRTMKRRMRDCKATV